MKRNFFSMKAPKVEEQKPETVVVDESASDPALKTELADTVPAQGIQFEPQVQDQRGIAVQGKSLPFVTWDGKNDADVWMPIPADCMRQIAGMAETSNQSLPDTALMIVKMALINYLEQGK